MRLMRVYYFTIVILDVKFMLLHDQKSEDSIKNFFNEVYEVYVKVKKKIILNFIILFYYFSKFTNSNPLYIRF